MADLIATTLNVSFDASESSSNQVVLQQMTTRFDNQGQLLVRCFSSHDVNFKVSTGRIILGEIKERIVREGLTFSNSNSTALKFPEAYSVEIVGKHVQLKQVIQNGVLEIVEADLPFTFDAVTNSIVCSEAVYGGCFVSYRTLYQMLYYIPEVNRFPLSDGSNAVSYGLGTIYGWKNLNVQSLELTLDMSSAPEWVEYARITSKIVLDELGTWEYPAAWVETFNANRKLAHDQRREETKMGVFSGVSHQIDPNNSFTDTRTHCIIKINTHAVLQYEDFNNGGDGYAWWFMPYFGRSDYNPEYEISLSDPPGGKKAANAEEFKRDLNNRTWRDVFLQVNKSQLIIEMRDSYPSLSEYKNS